MVEFDAYTEWLQIPAGRRPPTHYQLLGLAEGEADAQRIYQAAMQRMGVVRRYHLGEYAPHALRLQSEISLALGCLRDPNQKRRYDDQLIPPIVNDRVDATLSEVSTSSTARDPRPEGPNARDRWGDTASAPPPTGTSNHLTSQWQ